MSEYNVEQLTPAHFDELKPLMVDAFGDEVTEDYFRWKYLLNPAGEAVGRVARAADGTLAAFYGMIPERYRFGGAVHRIYQSCDTMTHSAHRRKGLFQRLALETYAQAIDADPAFFAFGFSGPMSTPGFVKMNWRIEAELPHLFRPIPLTLFDYIGDASCEDIGITEDLLSTAINLAKDDDGVVRSSDYLQWRFSNPSKTYQGLLIPDQAYAVYVRSGSFLFLLDFAEVTPGSGRAILRRLARLSVESRLKGILTWASPMSLLMLSLKSAGFVVNPWSKGPGSYRIPLIAFGQNPSDVSMSRLPIAALDHDSL